MSEAKHTPGPWFVKGEPAFTCVTDSQSAYVVDRFKLGGRSDEEHGANARLISAAPELLEQLQHALYCLTDNDPTMWAHPDSPYYSIHAAIAKATGK